MPTDPKPGSRIFKRPKQDPVPTPAPAAPPAAAAKPAPKPAAPAAAQPAAQPGKPARPQPRSAGKPYPKQAAPGAPAAKAKPAEGPAGGLPAGKPGQPQGNKGKWAGKPQKGSKPYVVAPQKAITVAQYILPLPMWQQRLIQTLQHLVFEAAPDTVVSIKSAQPVFESNGPMAFIRAAKAHVTFGFWRGTELTDTEGILDGEGDRMKIVKVKQDVPPPERALRALVAEAAALNAKDAPKPAPAPEPKDPPNKP
jgi:hypothetical protein